MMMHNDQQNHSERNGAVPARNTTHKHVLVVEDDRTHRALMMQILKNLRHRVTGAENGVAAMKRLENGLVCDLVILDWDMPICNGLETIRELRARQRRGDLAYFPVVAFTSYNRADVREACMAAGMDGYMPKDVWMPRWRNTLEQNLNSFFAGRFDHAVFDDVLPDDGDALIISSNDHDVQFDSALFTATAHLLDEGLEGAVEDFLEDAQSYIDAIVSAERAEDLDTMICAAHPLKSNTKGFGLMGLSRLAERINQLAIEEDVKTLSLPIALIQGCFEHSHTTLKQAVRAYKRENH